MTEWFEEFFGGLYGKVLPETFDGARTLRDARAIKRLLKLRRGMRALDVPCGMGRITIPLAHMGVEMTGVDLMASYVRRARRLAGGEGLSIRFLRGDMREIGFEEEFHAAFNWFGSFGYFSDADNLFFLKRVCRALRPGGRFLVEGLNKSWLRRNWRPHGDETIGGVRITHRRRWNEGSQRIEETWTLRKGRTVERRRIRLRVYNGTEVRALLRGAGFRQVDLFGHPPVGRFTRHSHRLIAVAQRPKS